MAVVSYVSGFATIRSGNVVGTLENLGKCHIQVRLRLCLILILYSDSVEDDLLDIPRIEVDQGAQPGRISRDRPQSFNYGRSSDRDLPQKFLGVSLSDQNSTIRLSASDDALLSSFSKEDSCRICFTSLEEAVSKLLRVVKLTFRPIMFFCLAFTQSSAKTVSRSFLLALFVEPKLIDSIDCFDLLLLLYVLIEFE